MIIAIKKKLILVILCFCMCAPCINAFRVYYSPTVAYAATTAGISFLYKKGYSVDGRSDYRFHSLSSGKPTIKLSSLKGASSSNKVKIKLYKGNTYYGAVNFSKAGNKQYSNSIKKGQYYLKISGGCGDDGGWISGKGTITPVSK